LEAVQFIETRTAVQESAFAAISGYLDAYEVETKGVYIQDVEFPAELVQVLTQREVAKQEKATFEEQQRAQTARIEMEKARGTAEMQGQLANAQVSVEINHNQANARSEAARGEAAYVETTARAEATKVEVMGRAEASRVTALGAAEASRTQAVGAAEASRTRAIGLAEAKAAEALGLARAEGFEAQKRALGEMATSLVAIANAIADGHIDVMPDVLVTSGGGSIDGLAASLIRALQNGAFITGDGRRNGHGDGSAEGDGPQSPLPERSTEPSPGSPSSKR
jgi:uncharacterized membrane protein YqiK